MPKKILKPICVILTLGSKTQYINNYGICQVEQQRNPERAVPAKDPLNL